MDKRIGIYVLLFTLVEIYLLVEIPWLGITLGALSIIGLIAYQVRKKRIREAKLEEEIKGFIDPAIRRAKINGRNGFSRINADRLNKNRPFHRT